MGGGVMVGKAHEDYFHILYQLAAEVNSTRTPENVLHSITEITAKGVGAKGCSLMLLTPDKTQLLHTAAYGLSDWYVRKGPVSVDESLSQALDGQAVAVKNASEDVRIQYRQQAHKEGIASILCVPMMLKEGIIGVMRVYTGEPREFNDDDIYFVCAAANLGAIALENARLYEAAQQEHEATRREMLEWRAALGDEWMVEDPQDPSPERFPPSLAGA
jgi:GAF domain-containing protein